MIVRTVGRACCGWFELRRAEGRQRVGFSSGSLSEVQELDNN